jgi:3-methyladenine DNA glycosylase AlkD
MKAETAKFNEVQSFFKKNANPELVKKYSRYFREGYNAWGIDQKTIESQRETWMNEWKKGLSNEQFFNLSDMLMNTGKYEDGVMAIWILMQLQKEKCEGIFEKVGEWLENNVSNWAHSDIISGEVLSFQLIKGFAKLSDFESWKTSESKWKRRSIPVALIKVLKNGHNPAELLDCIDPLMNDKIREVHQGLGWFLREVWKKFPAEAEDFLLKWKDTCGRLIIQYATEKMDKTQKEKFKKK